MTKPFIIPADWSMPGVPGVQQALQRARQIADAGR